MLKLAIEKLQGYPETHQGVPLKEFLEAINRWKDALDAAISEEDRVPIDLHYPKITLSG